MGTVRRMRDLHCLEQLQLFRFKYRETTNRDLQIQYGDDSEVSGPAFTVYRFLSYLRERL
jgi:hypothetical protein